MGRKLTIELTDGKEYNETKEGLSLKKILKSASSALPKGTKEIKVQYVNRKGTEIDRWVKVPTQS